MSFRDELRDIEYQECVYIGSETCPVKDNPSCKECDKRMNQLLTVIDKYCWLKDERDELDGDTILAAVKPVLGKK